MEQGKNQELGSGSNSCAEQCRVLRKTEDIAVNQFPSRLDKLEASCSEGVVRSSSVHGKFERPKKTYILFFESLVIQLHVP